MTLMERRRALMMQAKVTPILPAEYQEVKWIGSNGTQYINTGVKYYKTTVFIDGEISDIAQNKVICGSGVSGQMANKAFRIGIGTRTYGLAANANNIGESTGWHDANYASTRFQLLSNKDENTIVYNGVTYTSPKLDTNQANTVPLYLFAMNYGGAYYNITGKIYRATFWDRPTGETLADFIPCYRKSDGVIGMFDLVSETFKTNGGTGTFTKGGNV